jgi:hypothetical protein
MTKKYNMKFVSDNGEIFEEEFSHDYIKSLVHRELQYLVKLPKSKYPGITVEQSERHDVFHDGTERMTPENDIRVGNLGTMTFGYAFGRFFVENYDIGC